MSTASPSSPTRPIQAIRQMRDDKVPDLLNELVLLLVAEKPSDPLTSMITFLESRGQQQGKKDAPHDSSAPARSSAVNINASDGNDASASGHSTGRAMGGSHLNFHPNNSGVGQQLMASSITGASTGRSGARLVNTTGQLNTNATFDTNKTNFQTQSEALGDEVRRLIAAIEAETTKQMSIFGIPNRSIRGNTPSPTPKSRPTLDPTAGNLSHVDDDDAEVTAHHNGSVNKLGLTTATMISSTSAAAALSGGTATLGAIDLGSSANTLAGSIRKGPLMKGMLGGGALGGPTIINPTLIMATKQHRAILAALDTIGRSNDEISKALTAAAVNMAQQGQHGGTGAHGLANSINSDAANVSSMTAGLLHGRHDGIYSNPASPRSALRDGSAGAVEKMFTTLNVIEEEEEAMFKLIIGDANLHNTVDPSVAKAHADMMRAISAVRHYSTALCA